MKINKQMNLVIPIYDERDNITAYVHSAPISAEVFDAYFLVMTKTYSQIITEGLGLFGGPRVADKMLKKVSMESGVWEGRNGVQAGLLNQIYRLTNVIHIGERGWQSTPYEMARKSLLSPDDVSEVEAAIIYFTCALPVLRRNQARDLLGDAMKLWGAQISSLNSTEYMNTLPALTLPVGIGAKVAG